MNYLWTDEAEQFRHKTLEKDISTDVCIIGGGIAGIQAALDIAEAGFEVDIVEKNATMRGKTDGTRHRQCCA